MNKELNNIEANENAAEEVVEVETKQGFMGKLVGGVKKHWKKVVGGIILTGAGAVGGYVIAKKSIGDDDYDDDADFELDESDFVVDDDQE